MCCLIPLPLHVWSPSVLCNDVTDSGSCDVHVCGSCDVHVCGSCDVHVCGSCDVYVCTLYMDFIKQYHCKTESIT